MIRSFLIDLTDNSAHKCSSLKRQIPVSSVSSTGNNLLSFRTSGKSNKMHTCFFLLKLSLICVNLELLREITKLNQKILVHLAKCVSAKTCLVQWTFLPMQWHRNFWLKIYLSSFSQPWLAESHKFTFLPGPVKIKFT